MFQGQKLQGNNRKPFVSAACLQPPRGKNYFSPAAAVLLLYLQMEGVLQGVQNGPEQAHKLAAKPQ